MDDITRLLRARPDVLVNMLKAFGWRFHGGHGWVADVHFEGHSRMAILDKHTLAWRIGPAGRRDTKRGWLAISFHWFLRLRGVPEAERPAEIARKIQRITGPWPELQRVCDEQVPNGTPLHASSRMLLKMRMEGSVQNCTPEEGGSKLNPPSAHQIEKDLESIRGSALKAADTARAERVLTVNTPKASGQVSTVDTQSEDGVITVITSVPNVTPLLRPWRGPRGDGGAA